MDILFNQYFDIAPHAQERARVRVIQKKDGSKPFATVYDPERSRLFKAAFRQYIKSVLPSDFEIIDKPMILSCQIYLDRPKSVKRKYPEVKPDLSNYIKGIEDAMNKLVYTDDCKIVGYTECMKLYGTMGPGIGITLYEA
jgi:Holliday junction resolvase RusA-like endonuclease